MRFRVLKVFLGFLLGVATTVAVSEIFKSQSPLFERLSSILISAWTLLQSASTTVFTLFFGLAALLIATANRIFWAIFEVFDLKHSSEGAIEGLLHIGAIAVIFTAAYLGIDDPKKVRTHFANAKIKAAQFAQEVSKSDLKCDAWLDAMHFNMLAYIAETQLALNWWRRILFFFYRNSRLPFYNYFSRRYDVKIGWTLTLISTFFFLFLAAAKIWKLPLFELPQILVLCYFLFSSTIVCCFVGLMAQYRLTTIDKVLEREASLVKGSLHQNTN